MMVTIDTIAIEHAVSTLFRLAIIWQPIKVVEVSFLVGAPRLIDFGHLHFPNVLYVIHETVAERDMGMPVCVWAWKVMESEWKNSARTANNNNNRTTSFQAHTRQTPEWVRARNGKKPKRPSKKWTRKVWDGNNERGRIARNRDVFIFRFDEWLCVCVFALCLQPAHPHSVQSQHRVNLNA